MVNSTFNQQIGLSDPEAASPHRADGQPYPEGARIYPEMAAAGLWTTAPDLARFAISVQRAVAGARNSVISQMLAEQMVSSSGDSGWGLGVKVGGGRDHPYFTHDGADAGFQAMLVAYRSGEGVAILTNGDNGMRVALSVLRTIAHEYRWPDFGPKERTPVAVAPNVLQRYVGEYRFGRYRYLRVEGDGVGLFADGVGLRRQPILPESDSLWFYKDTDAELRFFLDKEGDRSRVEFRHGQEVLVGDAVPRGSSALALADLSRRVAQRLEDPRARDALTGIMRELRLATPDYDRLVPQLALVLRTQLPSLQRLITRLGQVTGLSFVQVAPDGSDVYDISFEHGRASARMLVDQNGKVERFAIQAR
jgi:hypothetical protein